MSRPYRILIALLGVYAAIYAAVTFARLPGSQHDPHAFMRDPAGCPDCHIEEKPKEGRPYRLLNFRKDLYTLCTQCHAHPVSHPVEIAPGREMAEKLPLDPDGTMNCVTCHAPHSSPYVDMPHAGRRLEEKIRDTLFPYTRKSWRTYFLRVPSPNGELCEACHSRDRLAGGTKRFDPGKEILPPDPAGYAGSRKCGECHPSEYRHWSRTPHARMVRSPRRDPSALLARFDGSPPFPPSEIAYVLGSRNVQRFISRKGKDLVVRTPIWMIRSATWNLSYWREMDWLTSCAGCHTTGYDPFSGHYVEESVGCESCHGPGRLHAGSGNPETIVHPAKIPRDRREMICESCHTAGHSVTGEFRFPVGYRPGEDLNRFYKGLVPKPGQDDRSFRDDGTYADRHRQYLYWRSRMLIIDGETCDLCRNFRLSQADHKNGGPRSMTAEEFCRSCHDGSVVPSPPLHAGARGECLSCHPPVLTEFGEISIHDHRYIPAEAVGRKDYIPPANFRSICFACHATPQQGRRAE